MLAGMYVVHQGATCQVARIIGAPRGYGQTKAPSATYELAPVDGSAWRYVKDPLAVDVPLTPACDVCGLPPGFGACAARGQHQVPQQPVPVEQPHQDARTCACSDQLCPCSSKPGHGALVAATVVRRGYRTDV